MWSNVKQTKVCTLRALSVSSLVCIEEKRKLACDDGDCLLALFQCSSSCRGDDRVLAVKVVSRLPNVWIEEVCLALWRYCFSVPMVAMVIGWTRVFAAEVFSRLPDLNWRTVLDIQRYWGTFLTLEREVLTASVLYINNVSGICLSWWWCRDIFLYLSIFEFP